MAWKNKVYFTSDDGHLYCVSATDRLKHEVGQGMATFRGRDGSLVWTNDLNYNGPCILHHDLVKRQATPTASAVPGGTSLAPRPETHR